LLRALSALRGSTGLAGPHLPSTMWSVKACTTRCRRPV